MINGERYRSYVNVCKFIGGQRPILTGAVQQWPKPENTAAAAAAALAGMITALAAVCDVKFET